MCNPSNYSSCPYYVNWQRNTQENMYSHNPPCPYFDNIQAQNTQEYENYSAGWANTEYMQNDNYNRQDYGPYPFAVNIDEATKLNRNYRTVLWTGNHLQLTLMSLNVGEDIGLEIHPDTDQFIRIEAGQGIVKMGTSKNNLNFQQRLNENSAVLIPSGTWHNVLNTGNRPLKLYSIYAPPHHPHGAIHETKAIAQASE